MTWRSGKRCEENNGGEEGVTFPAASSRRLERTPGVRDAIECRRGKVASLGEKEEEECVGNLKRDVSGSVEILSVIMAGNRQFCQNAKKDSLSVLEIWKVAGSFCCLQV